MFLALTAAMYRTVLVRLLPRTVVISSCPFLFQWYKYRFDTSKREDYKLIVQYSMSVTA